MNQYDGECSSACDIRAAMAPAKVPQQTNFTTLLPSMVQLAFTARCTLMQSGLLRLHASVCPSVCPSVTLVDHDHIGWKSWKLIPRTISLTNSLFVAQRPSTYFQGNMGKFLGDYKGGVGKSGVLEHISGNISETRKDRRKVTMEGL